MSSLPAAMRAGGRPVDPHFHAEECLFRRVPLMLWDDPGEDLPIEAVELPDISVARSKFAHAEWVRFDNGQYREGWAVVGVQVSEIPPAIWRDGFPRFAFRANHVPLEINYPHSEIRAFDEKGSHVNVRAAIPDDVHLEWRERLLMRLRCLIKPHQKVAIRDKPPASHKIEPHIAIP